LVGLNPVRPTNSRGFGTVWPRSATRSISPRVMWSRIARFAVEGDAPVFSQIARRLGKQ
jgi:hypothetical protein